MNVVKKPSPNFDDRKGHDIAYIILHYTGMESAEMALSRLTDKNSGVSSHYTIDEDGTVYQHVDEKNRAWHAGISRWQNMRDINAVSVGIEIVNPGHEFGYRAFPDAQIEAVKKLCLDVMSRYDIEDVLAHSDVAPDRKQDPGELFPWKELAEEGIGKWPGVSDEDMVKATGINVGQALRDLGYDSAKGKNSLVAFQRHYVPEVFEKGTVGSVCSLTKGRLYALLAGHLIS